MRHLHTIACAAIALGLGLNGKGMAQAAEPPANRFTGQELLEQTERDRRIWLGAMAQGMATGVALADDEAGACLSRWYFQDEAQAYANIISNLERYPDYHPSVIMVALARRACPMIEGSD